MENLKNTLFFVALMISLSGCKESAKNNVQPVMSDVVETEMNNDEQDNWIVLFDGTTFDNWKVYPDNEIPDAWVIEDGAMVLKPSEYRKDGNRYNLMTKKEFKSFVLSLEWRISEGANSGVMWGVKADPKHLEPYHTGPEIQVLDNSNHPDAKNGTTHQAGSLYDMIAPSKDVTKPIGEWNTYIITVDHNTNEGSVVLNGEMIVEFPVHGEAWDNMVANSKFADWPDFAKYPSGSIALQDHGEPLTIAYRNIKIKLL